MLARLGPRPKSTMMQIPLITDTPLYLRGLCQYNGWSKRGSSARGIPPLAGGMGPDRFARRGALPKPGGAPLSSCAFRSRVRQRRSTRSVVVPLLGC